MAVVKNIQWISEEEAAELMGLTAKYFRRRVQAGYYSISYRHPSRNKFQYNRVDIEKELAKTEVRILA